MPKRRANVATTTALGAALADLRTAAKLSQAEVARRMGTTQTAIARLESGRQNPSIGTLQDYARSTGHCLEIGFLKSHYDESGCVLVVES